MTALLEAVSRRTHDEARTAERTAAWLKRMRKELGLGQRQVARVAGVSRNTITSWERGRTMPTLVQIELLQIWEKNLRRAAGTRFQPKAVSR